MRMFAHNTTHKYFAYLNTIERPYVSDEWIQVKDYGATLAYIHWERVYNIRLTIPERIKYIDIFYFLSS